MTKFRILTKKELALYKANLFLTDIQKQIIVGTLLGDASMSLRSANVSCFLKKSNPVLPKVDLRSETEGRCCPPVLSRPFGTGSQALKSLGPGYKPDYAIKFEQSIKNQKYIEHLFEIFKPFCISTPVTRIINKKEENSDKLREAIYFKTFRHNSFIYYFNLFYKIEKTVDLNTGELIIKKTKKVPKNIHKLLTPRAVAYWFMDDGTFNWHNKSKTSKSYVFSTQGFEKHECQILLDALKANFNVVGELHRDKHYWRIYITKQSTDLLRSIIKPYILNEFYYKL